MFVIVVSNLYLLRTCHSAESCCNQGLGHTNVRDCRVQPAFAAFIMLPAACCLLPAATNPLILCGTAGLCKPPCGVTSAGVYHCTCLRQHCKEGRHLLCWCFGAVFLYPQGCPLQLEKSSFRGFSREGPMPISRFLSLKGA